MSGPTAALEHVFRALKVLKHSSTGLCLLRQCAREMLQLLVVGAVCEAAIALTSLPLRQV